MSGYYGFDDQDRNNAPYQNDNVVNIVKYEVVEPKRKKRSSWRTYAALILASSIVSTSAVGGALYYKFSGELKKVAAQSGVKTAVGTVIPETSKVSGISGVSKVSFIKDGGVTDIVKKVGPSVVGIRVTNTTARGYFGQQMGQSKSEGSGVVFNKDGYIMTNYHVVEAADPKNSGSKNATVEVFLPDKRQATAKFIGGDSKNDLAVIKIDLDDLTPAELGDSSQLEPGELAVAIGNPLGMDFFGSVTVGVISAVDRTMQVQEDTVLKLVQTDAAINPGNSGGALVNSQGQVIGINTVKISETGVEGIGFAIPMNEVKPIVDQLRMFGYVKGRPLVGVSGANITEVMARTYDVPVGVYVQEVTPLSGAAKAGIKAGDIITTIAGKEVKTMAELNTVKKNYKAGDTVEVIVYRDGQKKTLSLTFSEEK